MAKHDKTVRIEPKEAIFRINKDIRFSKDKTPYKLANCPRSSPRVAARTMPPGHLLRTRPENVKFYGGAVHAGEGAT
jgi:uncharacterized protein (DUF2461 family)